MSSGPSFPMPKLSTVVGQKSLPGTPSGSIIAQPDPAAPAITTPIVRYGAPQPQALSTPPPVLPDASVTFSQDPPPTVSVPESQKEEREEVEDFTAGRVPEEEEEEEGITPLPSPEFHVVRLLKPGETFSGDATPLLSEGKGWPWLEIAIGAFGVLGTMTIMAVTGGAILYANRKGKRKGRRR